MALVLVPDSAGTAQHLLIEHHPKTGSTWVEAPMVTKLPHDTDREQNCCYLGDIPASTKKIAHSKVTRSDMASSLVRQLHTGTTFLQEIKLRTALLTGLHLSFGADELQLLLIERTGPYAFCSEFAQPKNFFNLIPTARRECRSYLLHNAGEELGMVESEQKFPHALPWPIVLLILILWLAGSSMDVEKYTRHSAPAILALGIGVVFVICLTVRRITGYYAFTSKVALVGLWLLVAGLFAFIHPISIRHTLTQGNDSEDALYRGATNLLHGHYPYYSKTYLGNPITPMPGALLLDLPFTASGHAGLQNLAWLAVFMIFSALFFKRLPTAVLCTFLILINAHTFVNLMTGADYPANCFYVCMASYCFLKMSASAQGWRYWLSVAFLGISLSSRLSYLLIVPIVLAGYCARRDGFRSGLSKLACPLLITVGITVPFYFYDPAHFSPLHVANFLSAMTPAHQRAMFATLTGGAICISLLSFVVEMPIHRFFLLAGLATCTILLPPGVIVAIHQHFTVQGTLVLGYTDTAYILLCIWLCYLMESPIAEALLSEHTPSHTQTIGASK